MLHPFIRNQAIKFKSTTCCFMSFNQAELIGSIHHIGALSAMGTCGHGQDPNHQSHQPRFVIVREQFLITKLRAQKKRHAYKRKSRWKMQILETDHLVLDVGQNLFKQITHTHTQNKTRNQQINPTIGLACLFHFVPHLGLKHHQSFGHQHDKIGKRKGA